MQIILHTTQQSKHIHCHLITYNLFNYTVRSSDDTAWDGRTIYEQQIIEDLEASCCSLIGEALLGYV
jgi:hypothetical protein